MADERNAMDTSDAGPGSGADMSDLVWQVVSPDDEMIPRIRCQTSDSSSDSDDSSGSDDSDFPSTSTSKPNLSKNKVLTKDGALLSIVWCLSSFEEQQPASSAAADAGPSQPVDQPAEGDQPQEEAEPVAGPSSGTLNNSSASGRGRSSKSHRRRQRRRKRRNRPNDVSRDSNFSSDDFGSIESSPEAYRDREWTGFRFKSKFGANPDAATSMDQ